MTDYMAAMLIFPGIPVAILFLMAVFFGGRNSGRREIMENAVEDGIAHYDPKTREFKWGKM